ncbi:unnamed protein product [Enterobius vermicularis]|uniref:Dus domain-containing protein n=1 Tax=Enterobius vermicularis TaxID=51028 RepID=A0A0N4V5L7_ENTVE|nr:unnamed protein product [Enterobius vermicularis]
MSLVHDGVVYANKVILAPMVHAGRTPLRTGIQWLLRLLALEYGADLAYTEEIVDQKLLSSTKVYNEKLGTTDYVVENDVVLRICDAKEKKKCVLQVGTNDAEKAVKVARLISKDVAAIDINMGCPRPFSVSSGMGAALLSQPEKVTKILSHLVPASDVPVSCKIRVLDKLEDTIALAQLIEKCGVSAIGVHGRRINERRGDRNRTEEIREVARSVRIPVIANGASGSIKDYSDIEKFRLESGASSVMIARKALTNPSIFRKSGILASVEEEVKSFLKLACEYDENFTMTKYVVQRMLGSAQVEVFFIKNRSLIFREFDRRGQETVSASNVYEICKAWSMEGTYNYYKELRCKKKEKEVDETTGLCCIDITFAPRKLKSYCGSGTPKCVLNTLCDERHLNRPIYYCKCRPTDKRYEAVVEVAGQKFLSRVGQPNKKMAEQVKIFFI